MTEDSNHPFRVSFRVLPIIKTFPGGSRGTMLADGYVVKSGHTGDVRVQVREEVIPSFGGDGHQLPDQRATLLEIDVQVPTPDAAIYAAWRIAERFVQLQAFCLDPMHFWDTAVQLDVSLPRVRNLSVPNRSYPGDAVGISPRHESPPERLGALWDALDDLEDGVRRRKLETAVRWLYVASSSTDDATSYVATWFALETALKAWEHPKQTILETFVPDLAKREHLRRETSKLLAAYIPDEKKRDKLLSYVATAEMEPVSERWSRAINTALDAAGNPLDRVTSKEIRQLGDSRHGLVHGSEELRESCVRLRQIVTAYIEALLLRSSSPESA